MNEMKKRILDILKDVQPDFDFTSDVNFVENGYLDSFDVVTLVAELESTFDIAVSALEIVPENFASVESIARLVEKSPHKAV